MKFGMFPLTLTVLNFCTLIRIPIQGCQYTGGTSQVETNERPTNAPITGDFATVWLSEWSDALRRPGSSIELVL